MSQFLKIGWALSQKQYALPIQVLLSTFWLSNWTPMYNGFETEILIWNWNTVDLLNRICRSDGRCGFGFLNAGCLAVFDSSAKPSADSHSFGLVLYDKFQCSKL
jgi:hypothetical protein